MTDPRSRVPSGVPTGGEFAVETKAENDDLAVEKSAREKVDEALVDATGTHAERLAHFQGMYEVIEDMGNPAGPREMIDADVARELKLQERTERLISRNPGEEGLVVIQRALFEMHQVAAQRGSEEEFYIYSPRTASEVMIVAPGITVLDDPGAYDLLYGYLDTAANYDQAGSVEGWRKMWRYPKTKGGLARAERGYLQAKEQSDTIRNLVGADYPLYVQGVKP